MFIKTIKTGKPHPRILFTSDWHLGRTECRVDWIVEDLEQDYDIWVHLGDVFDAINSHDPRYQPSAVAPQYRGLDAPMNAILRDAISLVEPYADRLGFMLAGNHDLKLAKLAGVDLIPWLLDAVGHSSDLHDSAHPYFAGLVVDGVPITIHHGPRSRNRKALDALKSEIRVSGHFHQKNALGSILCDFQRGREKWRRQLQIQTGSYLESFQQNEYASVNGYNPGWDGGVIVTLHPKSGRHTVEML